ncbi:hypothetical protein KEM52_001202 [Ascosphaera acerosa]|nr:hypothetical protein KEM52_001202 [Ascosphaera acerosa]
MEPDGSETARETHISTCIENATASMAALAARSSSGPQRISTAVESGTGDANTVALPPEMGRPSLPAAGDPRPAVTGQTPSVPHGGGASSHQQTPQAARNPQLLRMLSFTATEKDCGMTSDGVPQECSICMEEYSPGESLARLECLCKFHKRCIVGWFDRKAECPVHKVPAWAVS